MLHKNWRGGDDLLLKNVQEVVTPANHVIARAGFTLSWAPGTLGFLLYFPANTGDDQKKSYVSAGPLTLCHMLNSSLVIALRS